MRDNVKENLNQFVKECQTDIIPNNETNWTGDQRVQNDCAEVGNHKSTYPCGLCMAKAPFDGKEKAELRTLGGQDEEHSGFVANESLGSTCHTRLIYGPPQEGH